MALNETQKAYQREYHKRRYADPEYRERKRRKSKEYAAKRRTLDPEGERQRVRDRMRRWREENPEDYRAAKERHRETGRRKAREYVYAIKAETPCADCGQRFDPVCMDFDHVTGEKESAVSILMARGAALSTLQREIAKCEVVCSNCHRIRTRERFWADGIEIEEVMPQ
jgi:hypothetical protein